jgi:hypothetical protein
LYPFPNIITQIKARRMRWVGHVACVGEERKVQGFRRKETTWKTNAQMGGWEQNGTLGDWLGECIVDPVSSG